MPTSIRWVHIALEILGVIALIVALGWLALWALFRPFKNFAGSNCTDTEQRVLASPDGKHTIKSFHRVCGTNDAHPWDFVYLSTGNSNPGYEYTPIATIKNVAPGQTSVAWNGSDEVSITYPSSAELGDVYAKVLDIRVTLVPKLASAEASGK
jgi:hypothetical protein